MAFVVLEAVAFPLMLSWGNRLWFAIDDWQFLAVRRAGSAGDLFRPYFSHWVTLPVLVYRGLWTVFGLRYLPYQVLAVALHLTAAALLRVIMRRAAVGPWLSTAAATAFVFFGAGAENVLVAFQIAFVGALVFGLTHLILADHDGPLDRRDGFALLAGFCGLMCSSVAISMVVVVGMAVLWRRGWRIAILHTGPLAAAYLVWFAAVGHQRAPLASRPATPASVMRFVLDGLQTTVAKLGSVPGIGIALFALTVTGLTIAFLQRRDFASRGGTLTPVALLIGAVVFLAIAGVGRSGVANAQLGAPGRANALIATGRQSRYLHIVAAMSLPGIACAGQAIIRRWRKASVVVVALVLVGVPGNVTQFSHFAKSRSADTVTAGTRLALLTVPRLPLAAQLPRSLRPDPFVAPEVTMGWLRDALRDGRLPGIAPASPITAATLTLHLVLTPSRQRESRDCTALSRPASYDLRKGQSFTVSGAAVYVTYVPRPDQTSLPVRIPAQSERLVLAGPVRLRFALLGPPVHGTRSVVCL